MSFHSFDPSRSWGSIACVVIGVHTCLITLSVFLESSTPPPFPAMARLVVQTVDLDPHGHTEQLLALTPTPLPPNPIKRSPLPAHPLESTPLPPTPLEHKTMKQESPTPARIPEVPPRPAPTPEPEPEPKEGAADSKESKPLTPKAPPAKKPEPVRKSQTTPKAAPQPAKKVDAKAKKNPAPAKKTGPPVPKVTPKKTAPPPVIQKPADDLKKKQAEEVQKQKLEAEAQKKKAELERQQKLLADAQEKMSKVAGNRKSANAKEASPSSSALSSLPAAISDLHVEALPTAKNAPPLSPREATYRDELAGRLKLLLTLPEYGDVKVSLTLNRSGEVEKVVILSAESAANKKYIEKKMPTLTFPSFGNNFESLSQYTFTINLSNE